MLFLKDEDLPAVAAPLAGKLSENLPRRFRGYPTSYVSSSAADDVKNDIQLLDYSDHGPVNHRVSISSIRSFIFEYLGFDIDKEVEPVDWLTFPEQKLLSITAGRVFHDSDEIGLVALRRKFAYYPHDIWLYLLAACWTRIEQEEHLMGRAGACGDELGAAIIANRLVRDLMRLCFLMEKRYAPYSKWFGTAFKELSASEKLAPILRHVVSASDWQEREKYLVEAYEYVASMHNRLSITAPLPSRAQRFHGRPYQVISMGVFSSAIVAKIADDSVVRKIAARAMIGSIDQLSDSTDLLADSTFREALTGLY